MLKKKTKTKTKKQKTNYIKIYNLFFCKGVNLSLMLLQLYLYHIYYIISLIPYNENEH